MDPGTAIFVWVLFMIIIPTVLVGGAILFAYMITPEGSYSWRSG